MGLKQRGKGGIVYTGLGKSQQQIEEVLLRNLEPKQE